MSQIEIRMACLKLGCQTLNKNVTIQRFNAVAFRGSSFCAAISCPLNIRSRGPSYQYEAYMGCKNNNTSALEFLIELGRRLAFIGATDVRLHFFFSVCLFVSNAVT